MPFCMIPRGLARCKLIHLSHIDGFGSGSSWYASCKDKVICWRERYTTLIEVGKKSRIL